ncbi:MAG: hypothetical protein QXZ28_05185, partial [Candidatus Methanomethylicaceae archaeon]
TAYPTKETVPLLLAKAYNNAKTLAVRAGIPLPETIREVLSLAELQSRALADAISKKHPDLSIN